MKVYQGKMRSGNNNWALNLTPTQKLINSIKKFDPGVFLVGFKFEPKAQKAKLIYRARSLISASGADLVVANSNYHNRYSAYLVDREEVSCGLSSRISLVKKLAKKVGRYERAKHK